MCNCVKSALEHGYIVQRSIYDEEIHEFINLNSFYMPIARKCTNGKIKTVNMTIKCCPICGDRLESAK